MLLLRLWNYLRGYVIIVVKGYFLEKFINICIFRQIFLWDIKKRNDSTLILKISIKGFRLLRPIAKKTGCRVHILKKAGLPFIVNRYRKRKTFIAGALAFVILFYILTSFIWAVEVTGNKDLEAKYIIGKLEEMGIKPGVLKYSLNPDDIAGNLMLNVKEIGWVGVVIKGTKVKVEVVERVAPPELVAKDVPSDIVSLKDAVVKSIVVKTGQEQVHSGDTVTKGQVLISGMVKGKNDTIPPRYVHADGTVKARTWYEKSEDVKTRVIVRERTGKETDRYALVFFTRELGLFQGNIPYEEYEKVEIRNRVTFGEDLALPFELVVNKYYENSITEKEIDADLAKQQAADEAYREVMKEIPQEAEIVKSDVNFKQNADGGMSANVIVECIENIGTAKKIGGN